MSTLSAPPEPTPDRLRTVRYVTAGLFGFIGTGLVAYVFRWFPSDVSLSWFNPGQSVFAMLFWAVPELVVYGLVLLALRSPAPFKQAAAAVSISMLCVLAVLGIDSFSFNHELISQVVAMSTGAQSEVDMGHVIRPAIAIAAAIGAGVFFVTNYLTQKTWRWRIPRFALTVGCVVILVILTSIVSNASERSYQYDVTHLPPTAPQQPPAPQSPASDSSAQSGTSTQSTKSKADGATSSFSYYKPTTTKDMTLLCSTLDKKSEELYLGYGYATSGPYSGCYAVNGLTIYEDKRPADFDPPYCGKVSLSETIVEDSCQLIGTTASGNNIYRGSDAYWGDFGGTIISLRSLRPESIVNQADILAIYDSMAKVSIKALGIN